MKHERKVHKVYKPKATIISCLIACFLAPVTPYNFKDHEEGSCGQYTPYPDINYFWLMSNVDQHFISAGSKYHLYRTTIGVTDHESIPEEEFLQNACIGGSGNIFTKTGYLSAFGLGNICNFKVEFTGEDGVVDFTYLDTAEQHVARHTVTLADNENFIFLATCWEDTQQRGWQVISTQPTLDPNTTQLVTEHATSLGFDPANFVVVPADSCGKK